MQQSAQIVSAVLGHGEGHDGDIFQGDEALGLILWQAELANLTGGTLRGSRNSERTDVALVGLGIRDKNGNLDLDVLRAFGDYCRALRDAGFLMDMPTRQKGAAASSNGYKRYRLFRDTGEVAPTYRNTKKKCSTITPERSFYVRHRAAR